MEEGSREPTHGRLQRILGWLSIPARHVFVLLGFLALVNVYTLRVSLSVAIVAMVKHPADAVTPTNGTSFVNYTQCQPEDYGRLSTSGALAEQHPGQAERFDWDAQVQGLVLGSFFYGYILTVLPGGVLAEQFGPKWLIGLGVVITSLLSMVLPAAAHAHYIIVVVIRILQGLAEVLQVLSGS